MTQTYLYNNFNNYWKKKSSSHQKLSFSKNSNNYLFINNQKIDIDFFSIFLNYQIKFRNSNKFICLSDNLNSFNQPTTEEILSLINETNDEDTESFFININNKNDEEIEKTSKEIFFLSQDKKSDSKIQTEKVKEISKLKKKTFKKPKIKLSAEEYLEKRKQDRHENSRQVRHRIEILEKSLKEFNFFKKEKTIKDKPIIQINFDLKIDNFGEHVLAKNAQKPPLKKCTIYNNKSFSFFLDGKGNQKEWLFSILIKLRKKELTEILQGIRPSQFKKVLKEIWKDVEWTYSKGCLNLNSFNALWTRNKIAQKKGYNKSDYESKWDPSALLASNGEVSVKTGLYDLFVLDLDTYKRSEKEQIIIKKTFKKIIKKLHISSWGLSKKGGEHFYFRCSGMRSCNIYIRIGKKIIPIGELRAAGTYVVTPISKGRKIIRNDFWFDNDASSQEFYKFDSPEKTIEFFDDFNILLGSSSHSSKSNSLNKVSKNNSNTSNHFSYEEISLKNIRIIPDKEKKESLPCDFPLYQENEDLSRAIPNHVRLWFIDENDKIGSFMIDNSWRENQYEELKFGSNVGRRFNIQTSQLVEKGEDYLFFKSFLNSNYSDKDNKKIDISIIKKLTKEVKFSNCNNVKKKNSCWNYAKNQLNERKNENLYGKWLIFVSWKEINKVWKEIENSIENNSLKIHLAKASNRFKGNKSRKASICVYTYRNNIDLIRNQLKSLGFTDSLCYKSNYSTDKIYYGHSSHSICEYKI